jgi:uncharacterized protein
MGLPRLKKEDSSPDSLTLLRMSRNLQPQRLNMPAFAREGVPLKETTPFTDLPRLAAEAHAPDSSAAVQWEATGELRPRQGADDDVWVHLQAHTTIALTCQRCMSAVATPVQVDQWYRFVETEEIAMAEDDESDEDLLVMEPQFDLLAVLEDELLMALPLVPMHDECPVAPVLRVGDDEVGEADAKPNPFAVLGKLKKTDS